MNKILTIMLLLLLPLTACGTNHRANEGAKKAHPDSTISYSVDNNQCLHIGSKITDCLVGESLTHKSRAVGFLTTPCPTEDAVMNCYWDAHRMGNNKGQSFYVILIGKAVCIKYWSPSYDRLHGYCSLL